MGVGLTQFGASVALRAWREMKKIPSSASRDDPISAPLINPSDTSLQELQEGITVIEMR